MSEKAKELLHQAAERLMGIIQRKPVTTPFAAICESHATVVGAIAALDDADSDKNAALPEDPCGGDGTYPYAD